MPPTRPDTLPIRPLASDDLDQAHALTRALRWPHRLQDWHFALELGEGFAVTDGAHLRGTAMAWPFGPDRGCFGMLIVAPDHQGRGLGARLTEAALAALGHRTVQLHATPDGVSLYRRLGFAEAGTIRQHQGEVGPVAPPPPPAGMTLRPGEAADLPALAALDEAATGMARARVLAALLAIGEAVVLEQDGAVLGFAALRPFGRGEAIGPVIAPDPAAAWALVGHLLARRKGAFVRIDIADVTLSPMLVAHGLIGVDEALRMVRGTLAPQGTPRAYALVSQAMG